MVAEKIITLLVEQYDMEAAELNENSAFDDMAFDSLDVAEMVMTLEDEYKVNIEMSEGIRTIGDLAKHIQEKMA